MQDSLDIPAQTAQGLPGPAMEPVWEASEASEDDLFVERENSFGQKVLEKSPSAISITARAPRTDEAIPLPANFVPIIPEARAVQHTRTMSEVEWLASMTWRKQSLLMRLSEELVAYESCLE